MVILAKESDAMIMVFKVGKIEDVQNSEHIP